MRIYKYSILFLFLIAASVCHGQQQDSTIYQINKLPDNYYSKVDQKLTSVNKSLTKKSLKYLAQFKKQEERLQKRLGNIDADAKDLFANSGEEYNRLIGKLKSKTAISGQRGAYNAYLDTLSTSLSFLKQFKNTTTDAANSLGSLKTLESKLQHSEKVKAFIAQRKQQLKELLSKHTKLPKSLAKEYAKLNRSAYYYSAQVKEYRDMLKDPCKAERKAIALLSKLPAFKKFMSKNSQLASMFRMPENQGTSTSLAGLQTRASVQAIVQQRVSVGGPNAQQTIQQNIAQARNELNQLKDKVNKLGGGGSDIDMPDFRPKNLKVKSFLKRLEYGTNVQFEKSTNRFPSSTNIGLSVGYKLDEFFVLGVGLSYKMGLGTIRRIVVSHQGIGLRSFADYKIKKSFYMTGGFEMNYNAQFKNIEQLKSYNDWQSSGLIGVSKKYSVSKKVKGEMKLLWDFLSYQQVPRTQAVVFRVGYALK